MTLPNFIVIGAGKSGTTSLYHWLRQHPDVFLPSVKEPRYFVFDPDDAEHAAMSRQVFPIRTLEEYERLYASAGPARAIGDVSPGYLESPIAAEAIHALIPDARIILSIRDPISRMRSHAQMEVRQGLADDPYGETISSTNRTMFTYAPRLRTYFELFTRERVHVMLFEDLTADPDTVVRDTFRFLGVDDTVPLDVDTVYNPGGLPKSRLVQRLIDAPSLRVLRPLAPQRAFKLVARMRKANLRPAPPVPDELKAELARYYQPDVDETAELIGRDLSAWLK